VSPRVKVAQGTLEGFEEGGVNRFLGVPYAAPPVGDLRWRAPAEPDAWDGARQAKRFSTIAVQTIGGGPSIETAEQSEDCLYLNVWTGSLDPAARQPVMVWIHGGGNLGGAGSEDWFDGAALAARGVTMVTFNYRLGAFGFLAHPAIGANFAVLDQIAILRWVSANIVAFGGDRDNVTIFGESAGAVAVRTLLSCPKAHGLFHRGIIESAGFEQFSFAPGWSYARAQAAAESLFDRLGTRDIDALRHVPTEALKLASHELSGIFPKPGQVHTPANLVWMPVRGALFHQTGRQL
jgi:para-nitrobenzyl esterase